MKVGYGENRTPAMPRLQVFVNGRYTATQRINIQEPFVKFGSVPNADGRHGTKRLFSCVMGIEKRSLDL